MKPHSTYPSSRPFVRSLAAASLVLVCACSSTNRVQSWFDGSPEPISPELVQALDANQLDTIRQARVDASEAQDDVAAARIAVDEARQLRKVAEQQVDIAEERVALAETRAEGVERNDVVEASSKTTQDATESVDLAKQRVEVVDALVSAREQGVDVAQARAELAEARVELVKARAASELDRADADEIDVREYEAWVRGFETEVDVATARYAANVREFRILREAFQGDVARFPEMEEEFSDLLRDAPENEE